MVHHANVSPAVEQQPCAAAVASPACFDESSATTWISELKCCTVLAQERHTSWAVPLAAGDQSRPPLLIYLVRGCALLEHLSHEILEPEVAGVDQSLATWSAH